MAGELAEVAGEVAEVAEVARDREGCCAEGVAAAGEDPARDGFLRRAGCVTPPGCWLSADLQGAGGSPGQNRYRVDRPGRRTQRVYRYTSTPRANSHRTSVPPPLQSH